MRGLRKGGGGRVAGLPPNGTAREGTVKALDMDGRGYGGGGEGSMPQTYRVYFPKGGAKACSVEGCPRREGTRTAMRVHFWRRHMRDRVIILDEGNLPHPICTNCDMFVPWRALNGRHKSKELCRGGVDKKRRRLAEAEVRDSADMAFEVYGKQIQTVPRFKYLGSILTEGGDGWSAVAGKFSKARKSWGRLQGILSREGATKRVCINALNARSIIGDTTHVSAPNSSTCFTIALKKLPDTHFVAPSLLRIPCSLPQLFLAISEFPATAGQSSSPSVKILPRYLNLETVSICSP